MGGPLCPMSVLLIGSAPPQVTQATERVCRYPESVHGNLKDDRVDDKEERRRMTGTVAGSRSSRYTGRLATEHCPDRLCTTRKLVSASCIV